MMKQPFRSALVAFLIVLGALAGIYDPRLARAAAPTGVAAAPTPCVHLAAPTLVAPADRVTVTSVNTLFDWDDVPGATHYQLEIDDDPAFGSWFGAMLIPQSQYMMDYRPSPGTYYWRVCGIRPEVCESATWSEVRRFTVCAPPPAPNLVAPADQAVVAPTNIRLDWGDVSGATQYLFQVDDDPAFGSPLYAAPPSSQWDIESLAPGTYYWRAKVHLSCPSPWSATWRFTVCDTLAAPTLLEPRDGKLVTSTTDILLDWSDVPGAEQYQFQVDDDPAFGSPQLAVPLNGSRWEVRPGDLAPGIYYWRVRVYQSCPSDWSEVRRFTICDPPAAPELISPADGAVVAPANITLDWSDVARATDYLFVIDDDPAFGSPLHVGPAPSSQWNIESLAPATYYWHAAASTCGWTAWSTAWKLQVVAPATPTPAPTDTPAATPTPPPTSAPTDTPTPPPTNAPAAMPTPTATRIPTATSTPTASLAPVAINTPTASPAATRTPTPVSPARAAASPWSCWPALLVVLVVVGGLSVLARLRRRRRPGE